MAKRKGWLPWHLGNRRQGEVTPEPPANEPVGRHVEGAVGERNAPTATLESAEEPATAETRALPNVDQSSQSNRPTEDEQNVPLEWEKGQVILDLYEVKDIYEGGGMGLVYRVHHRGWNVDLAVKSPRPGYFQTDAQKDDFTRECETWINLGLHPHIVSCHYVRKLGGIPRVFAEYLGGRSLAEWIRPDTVRGGARKLYLGGPVESLKQILDIAVQLAWGLHYAHGRGVIHQDIKPANVMMTPAGMAKVTDFGLAKARSRAGRPAAVDSGQSILASCGGMTPAYCSPEQANKQPLTRRTDIWSWAVSVLEMFVGGVTWSSGVAARDVLESYLQKGTDVEGSPPMPEALGELLASCLKLDERERPHDFGQLTQELRAIYLQVSGAEYWRVEPTATELEADSWNNRGVSLEDLGLSVQAETALAEALKREPHHLRATFNLGLLRWRRGQITDSAVLTELAEIGRSRPNDWEIPYVTGLTHLERRDVASAVNELEKALQAGGDRNVELALEEACQLLSTAVRCVQTFEGHTKSVRSVAFSRDGRFCLSGSEDKTLRLWNVRGGKCEWTFEGFVCPVEFVAFSPDGRFCLSGGDETFVLWDVSTGRHVRMFKGHEYRVTSVAFSPDGRFCLSGSYDRTLRLWDITTGRCTRTFEGHTEAVHSVAFSPDGGLGLSGSDDLTLRLWSVADGQCVREFEGHSGGGSVAFSPDGRFCLSGSDDALGSLALWDVSSGRKVRVFKGHKYALKSVAFSPDGRFCLSGSHDKTLRLWDVSTGQCIRTFEGHTQVVHSLAFSPDSRFCLSGAETPRLWDVSTGQCIRTFEGHTQAVHSSVAFSPDGQFCLSGGDDATLRLWNLFTGQCLREFEGLERCIYNHVEFSPDGRSCVSGCSDRTLRLWDLSTGQQVRILKGHTGAIESVAFSPDGRCCLSGSYDGTLKLWDASTGQCLRTFQGDGLSIEAVAFSPNRRSCLSGGGSRLRLWDVSTGQCLRTFDADGLSIKALAFSPNGQFCVAGGWDTLRLWDASTGECLRNFEGHSHWPADWLAFSPDGRFCFRGSPYETLQLFDVLTGQCVRMSREFPSPAALSPDGRFCLSGGSEKILRLWDISGYYRQWKVTYLLSKVADTVELANADKEFNALVGQALDAQQHNDISTALGFLRQSRQLPGKEMNLRALDANHAIGKHCSRKGLRAGWLKHVFEGHTGNVESVAFGVDDRLCLSGSRDKTLRLWDISTGQCIRTYEGHNGRVEAVAFIPGGHFCVSGSSKDSLDHLSIDNTLRVWDVLTGQCMSARSGFFSQQTNLALRESQNVAALMPKRSVTVEKHTQNVRSVAISPDARFYVTAGGFTARLWDASTGLCVRWLEGHTDHVLSATFGPDGRFCLTGSKDKTLRLWDVSKGQCIQVFEGHTGSVLSVAISPNGRLCLSGSADNTLRLWDTLGGRCVRTLGDHTGSVASVVFSPEGRFCLSGSYDKTVRLWDTLTGECIRTFEVHNEDVSSVDLSADGRFCLSGSHDQTLRLWELDWDYEFPGWADWDDGARPFLEQFLTLACPRGDGLTRTGDPQWTEGDFHRLLTDLQHRGYGWLRPDGVRRILAHMAAKWEGTPTPR